MFMKFVFNFCCKRFFVQYRPFSATNVVLSGTGFRTHLCGELRKNHEGFKVTLCGWVQTSRMGKFLLLGDWQGTTQVLVDDEKLKNMIETLPLESVVQVHGCVRSRPQGQENQRMLTGDIEVHATDVRLLGNCVQDLPFLPNDATTVRESLGMEYRYLHLRNRALQQNLRLRSQVLMKIRNSLCLKHGFVDVETPTLFKKTPGGAREFVVPTHSPGKFFCLPQSPQQFKQLLMVSGLDRYMQIARCYRDEAAKPDRQPEFTQIDLEMSFVTREDVMALVEDVLVDCWPCDPKPEKPFPVMTYEEALSSYGSDKPDTRFGMKITEVTSVLEGTKFPPIKTALESNLPVFCLNLKSFATKTHKKDVSQLKTLAAEWKEKYDVWVTMSKVKSGGEWQGGLDKQLGQMTHETLTEKLQLEEGDLVVMATGSKYPTCECLGKIRLQATNILESNGIQLRDNQAMNLLWVQDFPLFLPKQEGNTSEIEAAHHPFTAPHPEDADKLKSHPTQVRSLHYDLVLNGNEIGGGSIRIHDSQLQRYVLEDILKEDPSSLEHLLKALTFGCPPHGGIALGFDRLIAILCGAKSIRDVIAFPKSSEGKDLMAQAPAEITFEDKKYYHL